jgi:alpha-glucuronidase
MIRMKPLRLLLPAALLLGAALMTAEDGYRLWLRYDPVAQSPLLALAGEGASIIEVQGGSPTLEVAREELLEGLYGLLPGVALRVRLGARDAMPELEASFGDALPETGSEGYLVAREGDDVVIVGGTDLGALYGVFAFLRHVQTGGSLDGLPLSSTPRIRHRLLNHWDNLNRSVERGQAGQSLWEWFELPDYVSPRYRDYARANASIGVNGTVLTNVNANARVLTAEFLPKAAAIADVLRPYGIRVYLTARFSAPIELDGLPTADPREPAVREWWRRKVEEVYHYIPDFGGFLVKANSEGQPGPGDYGRSHAEGANMLADALAPHGGFVMWRAFVYSHENTVDRHKQAYDEFVPLDGQFRDNVTIQVKNGAIDFMPREPFSPLFGAMPRTPLALELQITKEYLGGAIHLAFLGPLFEEVFDSDTLVEGEGSTVARVVDGSLHGHSLSVVAGVANAGSVRNWTGHPLAQADWYAFGRLAWDPDLDSATIAEEWIRMTFGNDDVLVEALGDMLLESREAVVNYSMPLGLHHIMARAHHYGPGPWVTGGREDWTSLYYHRATPEGIGFDRTPSGSNALEQYAPPLQDRWGDPATTPPELLLWFHHVPWDHPMPSGRTLWEELGAAYQRGVDAVRSWRWTWEGLAERVDPVRHAHVAVLLARQEREAIEYKDACLLYFQTFADLPWPEAAEPPLYSLDHYQDLRRHHVPGDPADQ